MEVIFRLVRKSSHVVRTRGDTELSHYQTATSTCTFIEFVHILLSVSVSSARFDDESTV